MSTQRKRSSENYNLHLLYMAYDNYTCKYVFASSAADNNLSLTQNELRIQLPFCKERTPNMKIELVQAKMAGADEFPGLAIRMSENPSDYYSLDNKGAILGIAGVSYQRNTGGAFQYALHHDINPSYVISSGTRELGLSLEQPDGSAVAIGGFASGVQFILKLSYPRQPDEIQQQYSAQIHRMGN
jgi:hypothetical protein